MQNATVQKRIDVRKIAMIAMLSEISTVLMFFSFNVPMMPGFIKMDFSELPALIASFTLGPVSGVMVCLVKNLVNAMFSTTGLVGELSNFILGSLFVFPAGLIYQKVKGFKGAVIGSLSGALMMALLSVFTNYYVVYPVYMKLFMPLEAILGAYQVINPNVETLWQALFLFNMPFTFIKGMCSVVITLLTYHKLAPLLNGRK